jgi:hypothetical protein
MFCVRVCVVNLNLLNMKYIEFTWGRGNAIYILPTLGWQRWSKMDGKRNAKWVLWAAWGWWYAEVGN